MDKLNHWQRRIQDKPSNSKKGLTKEGEQMTLDELRAEAEAFFEWPGDRKDIVTLESALLFAREMVNKATQAKKGHESISARQIGNAINELPHPKKYYGEFYRVGLREKILIDEYSVMKSCNKKMRVIEFKKSEDGAEWILNYMPGY